MATFRLLRTRRLDISEAGVCFCWFLVCLFACLLCYCGAMAACSLAAYESKFLYYLLVVNRVETCRPAVCKLTIYSRRTEFISVHF